MKPDVTQFRLPMSSGSGNEAIQQFAPRLTSGRPVIAGVDGNR